MEKAAKAVRRSGVKLLSLGGGHGELNMVISEQKDVKNSAKAFMMAQNSSISYLLKWAAQEENRAIQDVSSQLVELNLLWTEVQREFTESLKDFKHMFDLMLEGEKHVDHAKNHLAACEQRELRIKKELKRAAQSKKATAEELRGFEKRLIQAERQRDLAILEVEDKRREQEVIKAIRFKEGLHLLSTAYAEMGRKAAVIFDAQCDVATLMPDAQERDLDEIKYTGAGATKQCVLQAKERLKQLRRDSEVTQCATDDLNDLPPPYTPGNFYDHTPTHPALRPLRYDSPAPDLDEPHLARDRAPPHGHETDDSYAANPQHDRYAAILALAEHGWDAEPASMRVGDGGGSGWLDDHELDFPRQNETEPELFDSQSDLTGAMGGMNLH